MSETTGMPVLTVVFMGTPTFAVPVLQTLLEAPTIRVLGVLTQPDRPAGRGQKLTPPPVKVLAQSAGLQVHQPERLRKDEAVLAWLAAQQADFFVTAAFGQILPKTVLAMPRYGTVNVHASLLPELRGPNPVQWAILQGKTETGITTMLTDVGVDTGDMLLKQYLPIGPTENAESLLARMAEVGGPLLITTLQGLAQKTLKPTSQDHTLATHAPKLSKEDAQLDWHQPAQALHNKIRGQQPWPGAVTHFADIPVKILASRLPQVADGQSETFSGETFSGKTLPPGQVVAQLADAIQVQTGQGILEILSLQPAGKKPMAAPDWLRGLGLKDQTVFFGSP